MAKLAVTDIVLPVVPEKGDGLPPGVDANRLVRPPRTIRISETPARAKQNERPAISVLQIRSKAQNAANRKEILASFQGDQCCPRPR